MAFPNVIVDCAFDNDINESMYAQTGYSDITRWVQTISGTLRGRSYEMDQVETGSLRIALDNTDGRFTPSDPRSPYYPCVTPARRLRIRGLNLLRPNIAAAGSLNHDARGFTQVTDPYWTIGNAQPITAVANTGLTSPLRTLVRTNHYGVDTDFDGDTPSTNTVDGLALCYEWAGAHGTSDSYEISHPIGAGTHHIQAVLPTSAGAGNYGVVQFILPAEAGRNMRHSIYNWRVSGTEGASTMWFLVEYYDADGAPLSYGSVRWTNPTTATPTERHVDSTCPVDTAYAVGAFVVQASAAIPGLITYGFEKIMSCYTPNIASNPATYVDAYAPFTADQWYVAGGNGTATNVDATNHAVAAVMSSTVTDTALYSLINGTIPGVDYDVSIDVRQYTAALGTPTSGDLFISADGGRTGATVSGRGVFSTGTLSFTADGPTTSLTIEKANGTAYASGWKVEAKNVTVYPTGESTSFPGWEMPKAIFEGWVEAWPLRAAAYDGTMSVVVNDRLARLGSITLDSPWGEQERSRGAALILPLDDSPTGDRGHGGAGNDEVAMSGAWADISQALVAPIEATHASLAGCNYTLGVPGPAGANSNALELITGGVGYNGYFVPIPYSNDYVTPPPPPPPPQTPASIQITQPGKPAPVATIKAAPVYVPTYAWRQYTTGFYATWSHTYAAGGIGWGNGAYIYQGYWSGGGNIASMVGFNYGSIKSILAGVTVISCKISLYSNHWYWNSGGWVALGTHVNGSPPGGFSGCWPNRFGPYHTTVGSTSVFEMGSAIGKEFQAGSTKGITVGPGRTTGTEYYGSFNGASLSGRPALTITYNRRVQVS